MTTDQVIAFATPIAVIIAAIVQQLNARKAGRDRDEVKEKVAEVAAKVSIESGNNATKLDAIGAKADHITQLTNGHLTQVSTELKTANEKIAKLEKMITSILDKKAGGEEKGRE